jgi:hypothetical protein
MLTESRKSEIIKLSGEAEELKKTTPGAGAKNVMLQQLLDDANEKHAARRDTSRLTKTSSCLSPR